MKRFMLCLFALFLVPVSCTTQVTPSVGSSSRTEEEILISAGFTDNDTYRIVCRGFPMEGFTGVQAENMAMEAARLNAIYFVKRDFDPSVDPGRYGEVERYEKKGEFVIVYYVVRKKGLKKLYSPSKPRNVNEAAPLSPSPDEVPAESD